MMDPHDRYYKVFRSLRAAAKADLVCLVTETGVGPAYYGARGPSFTNAFNIIRQPYLTGEYYPRLLLSLRSGHDAGSGCGGQLVSAFSRPNKLPRDEKFGVFVHGGARSRNES
jgi:hypothetical protein